MSMEILTTVGDSLVSNAVARDYRVSELDVGKWLMELCLTPQPYPQVQVVFEGKLTLMRTIGILMVCIENKAVGEVP